MRLVGEGSRRLLMSAPTHRHRSKSAPRGRSPDPRALRKAAKSIKDKSSGYVTPPPNSSKDDRSSGSKKSDPVRRKISFGENKVHHIEAENISPADMSSKRAAKIISSLKDPSVSRNPLFKHTGSASPIKIHSVMSAGQVDRGEKGSRRFGL